MKKWITTLLIAVLMTSALAVNIQAAANAKVTRIYGTETRAIACHGFKEFYASSMFVWFQMDTDVDAPAGLSLMNQQVLGDSTIKPSANDKIKIGGMTVKQLNASAGNPYTAMIAYEANGEGKIRICVWMSWGGSSIQDIFKKEVHPDVTVEVLSGMKIPGKGYSASNKVYAELAPVKYKLSIADLEFLSDKTATGYDESKKDWVKPMFENLAANWTLVGGASSSTTSSSSSKSSSVSSKSTASSTSTSASTTSSSDQNSGSAGTSTDSSVAESSADLSSQDSSETASENASGVSSENSATSSGSSSANNETTPAPILPIVLGILGIAIIGGGIGYFIYLRKKSGN